MEAPYPPRFSGQIKINRSKILGKGGYGTVYEGIYANERVAVKRITVDSFRDKILDREIRLQPTLNHVNVLKILAVEQNDDFRFIVLELCDGTLKDVIDGKYEGAPLPSKLEVLYQIAKGLDYIHEKNIIHRDVKPPNILISKHSVIKLSDFGFCKKLDAESSSSVAGVKGTLIWIAPELQDFDYETGEPKTKATKASDIFATGLVFFVFLSKGTHPFGDMRSQLIQIPTNIKQNTQIFELNGSNVLKDVISQMIEHDPDLRMAITNVKTELEALQQKEQRMYAAARNEPNAEALQFSVEIKAIQKEEEKHPNRPLQSGAENSSNEPTATTSLVLKTEGEAGEGTAANFVEKTLGLLGESIAKNEPNDIAPGIVKLLMNEEANSNQEDDDEKKPLYDVLKIASKISKGLLDLISDSDSD